MIIHTDYQTAIPFSGEGYTTVILTWYLTTSSPQLPNSAAKAVRLHATYKASRRPFPKNALYTLPSTPHSVHRLLGR